jgi:hypothetical protein
MQVATTFRCHRRALSPHGRRPAGRSVRGALRADAATVRPRQIDVNQRWTIGQPVRRTRRPCPAPPGADQAGPRR